MTAKTAKPITRSAKSDTSGLVVLLRDSSGNLRRAFNIYPEVLPGGVTFEPQDVEGVREHIVDKARAFPDDEELRAAFSELGSSARTAPLRPQKRVGSTSVPATRAPDHEGVISRYPAYRIKRQNYRAQDPFTVKADAEDEYTGRVVLLNVGSKVLGDAGSKKNQQVLMRAFEFDNELLPNGVTFVPPSDGMVVIDVKQGAPFPSNDFIEANLLPNSIARNLYAGPTPQGVGRRP